MDKERAGKLIKQRRFFKGMTQSDLAALLNVKQATVALWETGTSFPRPKSLLKLCDVLDIPVEELLKAG